MSGRLILNLETIFALAVLACLLFRSRGGVEAVRFRLGTADLPGLAAISCLCVVVFWRAIHIYFLSDDFILTSTAQGFDGAYGPIFTHGGGDGFFRPLGYISFFWTAPWAGFDPVRWHVVGLALHIVNALLVYALAAGIGMSRAGAWLASALFAVHGAHPEAVVWIAGRFDVLSAVFALTSLVAFIWSWENSSWAAGLLSVLAMALGMLTKEAAYAVPLMMLVFVASRPGAAWKRRVVFLTPFFLVAVGLFVYRWVLQGGIGGYVTAGGAPQIFSLNLVSIVKALVLRLWAVLFFPVDWAAGVPAWLMVGLVAYAAVWVWAVWVWSHGKARSGWAGILVPLGFVVAAAIPPVQQLLIGADLEKARLLYLPSVGFCLLAAAVWEGAFSVPLPNGRGSATEARAVDGGMVGAGAVDAGTAGAGAADSEMVGAGAVDFRAVRTAGAAGRVSRVTRAVAGAVMLGFTIAALVHNLSIWEQVAAKSQMVCRVVAPCSNLEAVTGLPRSLDGVYFFANGLEECARLERSRHPELAMHSCSLAWDDHAGELRGK